jgi:hypothetical protein
LPSRTRSPCQRNSFFSGGGGGEAAALLPWTSQRAAARAAGEGTSGGRRRGTERGARPGAGHPPRRRPPPDAGSRLQRTGPVAVPKALQILQQERSETNQALTSPPPRTRVRTSPAGGTEPTPARRPANPKPERRLSGPHFAVPRDPFFPPQAAGRPRFLTERPPPFKPDERRPRQHGRSRSRRQKWGEGLTCRAKHICRPSFCRRLLAPTGRCVTSAVHRTK